MPAPAPAAGARTYAPPKTKAPTTIAEYPLNPFESFVATISERPDGRRTASISRIKHTPDGLRRMAVLEFGTHRTIGDCVAGRRNPAPSRRWSASGKTRSIGAK